MTVDFETFSANARAQGCDEVLERRWGPLADLKPHSHPFHARALVVEGEMWLSVGEAVRHLRPGDTFELESGTVHSERYGPVGAAYWVARSNA